MGYYNSEQEVLKFLAEKLGVSVDYIQQTTIIRRNFGEQTIDIIHPALIDQKYPITTKISFIPTTFSNMNLNLLTHYAKMLRNISPHFTNIEDSDLKGVIKNGLSVVMNTDATGSVSIMSGNLVNYRKFSTQMVYGYTISFNPDLVKYYRSHTKEALMNSVIKPFTDMFIDMIFLHSVSFLMGKGEKVDKLKNLINTIFEASFNKKKYEGVMTIERSSKKPIVIVLESLNIGASEKVSVSVKNVEKIRYRGKTYQATGDTLHIYSL